jgi:teichuronic acid biosynthesis glycosyltransferase TuaG
MHVMNSGDAPLPVSVVIPCWRCADSITKTVESVIAQTRPPAEIILVDDASPDDGATLRMLHTLATRSTGATAIRVVALSRNSGPGGARNAGREAVTQQYVAFIDADDIWHPNKLEIQMAWMQAHPDVALSGHATMLAPHEGLAPGVRSFPARRATLAGMLVSNAFPTRTVLMRSDLPFRFGDKSVTEDYLFWLEAVASGYECWRLETVLAYSLRPEFGAGGYSGELWTHERRELCALRELRARGHVGSMCGLAAQLWSVVKYLRRVVLRRLRRL